MKVAQCQETENSYLCECLRLTLEAENSVPLRGVREAGLVFVLVERADPQQASSTLRPGHGDGVADAAVGQPAVVAAVQPRPPGREQLTGRCQDGVVLLALLPRLLQGEFIAGRRRIEDLT